MSAPATIDHRPINSIEDCIAYVREGEKPQSQWRIGAEHEKFILDCKTNRPLAFAGTPGIEALLYAMIEQSEEGYQPIMENDNLIALKINDGGSITLEPGGQLELSGAPLENLHQICGETNHHLSSVKQAMKQIGAKMLSMGFFPELERQEFHWMPKGRYQIMRNYMPKKGNLGVDMMQRTCTVQVNLDFKDEGDFVEKMRVSAALQPLATALFAASPFVGGKPCGYKSWRSHIWTDTDPDRCGTPSLLFDEDFSYARWVEYVLDVPMYFIHRKDEAGEHYHDVTGQSFRSFLAGDFILPDGTPAGKPSRTDWANHMTTAFPEVRAKTFIEMRGADAGPWTNLCALPALWVGLLYDATSLADAAEFTRKWNYEDVLELRELATKDALAGKGKLGRLGDLAQEMLSLAEQGLKRRGVVNAVQNDERLFLEPLLEISESKMTLADRMLQDYEGRWNHSIKPIYGHCEGE